MLWVAFVGVHALLIGVEYLNGRQGSWDVDQLYSWWSAQAATGFAIPGITDAWVYPAFALLPMLLAQVLAGAMDYVFAWGLIVTVADALVFGMLVGRATSRARVTAAWFWLIAALALGGVGMFRLDALTVPLALAGSLWLVGRPWLGSVLLALAAWLKVWPAAILVAAFIAVRRRWAVAGGAAGISAVIVATVVALGGSANLFSFVGDQTGRGLQIEAPVTTVYLWLAITGDADAWIYYDQQMVTFQATGPNVDAVIAAMTPLLVVALAAVAALGAVQVWRGAAFVRVFPPLATALVLGFIVFNKVGSPQYGAWLIAPVAVGLVIDGRRWRPLAVLTVVTLAITQLIFPWGYDALLVLDAGMVLVLTLRNALLVALFVWTVVLVVRSRMPQASVARSLL
ncbi:glycosyltransferase family 87 protein [Microbacterium awajiense]|uniref:Glycosyltransferase family 87 protein n=1 Tax=Microbacterium awajiense TaxID=415214 RepID=A0ABP7AEI1_9MICO